MNKQTQKKVHFSIGQAVNKNYYNLCLAVLQRAEQDKKGCSVLYRGSKKSMTNEIETARQSAEVFFNNSFMFNLIKEYVSLYRKTACKNTVDNLLTGDWKIIIFSVSKKDNLKKILQVIFFKLFIKQLFNLFN